MSSQICSSKLPSSTHGSMSNHNRPLANYHLCVWGNIFLSPPSKMKEDATIQQQHGELKEEIRRMVKHDCNDEQTLEATSLRFRLLRENGFSFQCDTFYKFKDDEGNFDKSLTSDVKGLLELYDAAHLRVHGEDILEEALGFTTTHLDLAKAAGTIEFPLSVLISRARDRPICKCLPRLEARRFIDIYKDDGSHDKTLLKFAELDFNLLQNLHKEELSKISKWWKDFDFAKKLPFIRNRLVECYFWILKVYFEPQYSLARKILTKLLATCCIAGQCSTMTSMMDDIYDSYGTLEELKLLTHAIQRWDADCIDQLPEYMKFFYKPLLDVYGEVEKAMSKEESYRVEYSKNTFKQLSEAYMVEANWCHENYVPTMEEYMRNVVLTAGYIMLTLTSFIGMGDLVTPKIFNWASTNPKIIVASSIICRLMDDIASHKVFFPLESR
ncbi:hypothetical protein PVK06_041318 [Gossypium arboreum]|uniref:(+)-delta-cadinene synthase n=1 Tax=Gossypium arboreum TaxID=29729 RepID=A0ABR0N7W6_GOSAR|nr:hypothetical protein PVK06_041318 [Gossypium arboreum]